MRTAGLIGVSLIALVAAPPAWAQAAATQSPAVSSATQDADASGEIVVTATKRTQTLDKVPVSVSVTSAKTIQQAHITDLIDLQSVVPSLKVQQFSSVGQTNFTIRGFGNGAGNDGIETSVASTSRQARSTSSRRAPSSNSAARPR